jgi:tRNA threonylcarbamoyladenosine biosynthesis protein TsaB
MPSDTATDKSILLAADTSTRYCTVAVCRMGEDFHAPIKLLAETVVDRHRLHSERLISTVDWALKEADVTLRHLGMLAISNGPGSFTGLRIGSAAWKGLALACRLPLVAVPTLDAMSRLTAPADALVVPMLDARMNEVFGAVYRYDGGVRRKLTPDMVCPVETLLAAIPLESGLPVIVIGDGAERFEAAIRHARPEAVFMPPTLSMPRASTVALEAMEMLAAGACTDPGSQSPLYLRKSQPEMVRDVQAANAGGAPGEKA